MTAGPKGVASHMTEDVECVSPLIEFLLSLTH
jgi:hypothetical protein